MKKQSTLALALLAVSLTAASAAETWPARPVKVIVGFAAGGPTDLFARLIAQSLSAQTKQNFFVEDIGGAGGNVGTERAAKSPPDGYTLLVTGGNITNNPFLYKHVPFDPIKDFDAVTVRGDVLCVSAQCEHTRREGKPYCPPIDTARTGGAKPRFLNSIGIRNDQNDSQA